ncbi:MAG: hypothetical protein ACODAJ_05210 [Planctomycetota bacterium]
MNGKDTARQVIDALPDDATVDDIIHALYIRVKCERGAQEIREGKGVPHDEAKRRMQKRLL